eukprot:gene15488-18340_t
MEGRELEGRDALVLEGRELEGRELEGREPAACALGGRRNPASDSAGVVGVATAIARLGCVKVVLQIDL